VNKQELIENIKKITYSKLDYNSPEGMLFQQKFMILELVKQLDEQPEIAVPEFVADWFEANKYKLEIAIWDLTTDTYVAEPCQLSEIQLWLKESDRPYEILIRMKDGYVIDKEPIYEVVFLEDDDGRYLLMELGEKSYEVVHESENDGHRTQWFTESEIKAIDERYWAFAVQVEEVE